MEEDSIQQLRKELEEVHREIQELLKKQTQLQQRLEVLEQKGLVSSVPSVATPAPPSNISPHTPAVTGLLHAEPLSKRLDVALGALPLDVAEKRQRTDMTDLEEVHDRQASRSPPSTSPGVLEVTSLANCVVSWDALGALLRLCGFRCTACIAWSCHEWLKLIRDAAFAFEQWFPSRILVLGGLLPSRELTRSVEVFDGKWQRCADMTCCRAFGAAVCTSDGRVLVIGGKDGDEALDSVEEYNLDSNTWKSLSPLTRPRWGLAAVEYRNQVYVLGGRNDEHILHCEILKRSEWQLAPSLIEGRSFPTAAVLGGDLFVLGGATTNTVERLDTEACRWTIEPLPPQVPIRISPTMVWSPSQGLVSIGGATAHSPSTALARSECLTLQFGQASWVQLPSWRIPRLSPAAAVSSEGDIYILGGCHNKEASALADRWSPESRSWREMPPMLAAREGAACVIVR